MTFHTYILKISSEYIHLSETKVWQDKVGWGKLRSLVVVLECLVNVILQLKKPIKRYIHFLTLYRLNCWEEIEKNFHSSSFCNTEMAQVFLNPSLSKTRTHSFYISQYNSNWWPNDARNITRHNELYQMSLRFCSTQLVTCTMNSLPYCTYILRSMSSFRHGSFNP